MGFLGVIETYTLKPQKWIPQNKTKKNDICYYIGTRPSEDSTYLRNDYLLLGSKVRSPDFAIMLVLPEIHSILN